MIANQDIIHCRVCRKVIDKISIVLPCGFFICASHLNTEINLINCLVCKNHQININECLDMPRNKEEILKNTLIKTKCENITFDYQSKNPIIKEEIQDIEETKTKWDSVYCKSIITLDEPTTLHYCFDILKTGEIIGECYNTLKIWNGERKCVKIFKGHTNRIFCFEMLNANNIITGSTDKTLKLWDTESTKCLRTFNGHEDWINCMQLLNNRKVITGSDDNTIKVWDVNNGKCLKTLIGHNYYVQTIKLDDIKLISGSADRSIKIWDLNAEKCLRTFIGHNNWVLRLESLNYNQIVSGSGDNTIKIWDVNSGKCVKTLEGHQGQILCLRVTNNGELVSSSKDKTIKIWDINTGRCLKTLLGHSDYIYCFQILSNGNIVSGSVDRTLRVWG